MTEPVIEIIRESAPKGEVVYVGFFISENDRRVVLGSHVMRGAVYGPTIISKTRIVSRQVIRAEASEQPDEPPNETEPPPTDETSKRTRGRKRRRA